MKYPIALVPQSATRDLNMTIAMRSADDTGATATRLRTVAGPVSQPVGVPIANPVYAGQTLYPNGIIPKDRNITIQLRQISPSVAASVSADDEVVPDGWTDITGPTYWGEDPDFAATGAHMSWDGSGWVCTTDSGSFWESIGRKIGSLLPLPALLSLLGSATSFQIRVTSDITPQPTRIDDPFLFGGNPTALASGDTGIFTPSTFPPLTTYTVYSAGWGNLNVQCICDNSPIPYPGPFCRVTKVEVLV